jgi:fructose/tagatose bisphosphate aldolase
VWRLSAIATAHHGAYKFKPGRNPSCASTEGGARRLQVPIVLHGVFLPKFVKMTTKRRQDPGASACGGDAAQAARMAVCKINIDSTLAMTGPYGILR